MMRTIYKKSSRVIIWLGLEQTYIPAALELLALAARRSAEENPEQTMNLGDRKEVAWDKELNEKMGFPPRGKRGFLAFSLPWSSPCISLSKYFTLSQRKTSSLATPKIQDQNGTPSAGSSTVPGSAVSGSCRKPPRAWTRSS